jgi:capsule polysaccharide export protein KpsE/RkpR
VQGQLSTEQWEKLPPAIRGALQGGGRQGAQAFSAVNQLDRMLVNPLLVLLDLKSLLGFSDQQVGSLQAASDSLQEKLAERRGTLGSRFDGVAPAEQAALFQQIMPQIEAGRDEIRAALRSAQAILTPEQWSQVPAQVRDPFAPQPARTPPGGAPRG